MASPSPPRGSNGRAPSSPESVSSERPVVSGLGLSSASSSASLERAESVGTAAPPARRLDQEGRSVQDRLTWVLPKPSRKAKWRRRKSLMRQQAPASARPRWAPLVMAGACFRCLQEGHYRRECKNDIVCIRCVEEGHGSAGCKRPRSPDSEEELRHRALAVVAARGACPRRDRASQPGARGQGAPAAAQPGARDPRTPAGRAGPPAPPPPPPPPPPPMENRSPEAWPSLRQEEVCFPPLARPLPCIIPRSEAMIELERRLRYASVVFVRGTGQTVSRRMIEDAIVQRRGIPREAFSVHHFKPENFLVAFVSREFQDRAAAGSILDMGVYSLVFRRWTRMAQAERTVARTRVRLAIEGIPPHAWEQSTVEHLLDTSCALDCLAPETISREDLGTFRLEAWTKDLEMIPPERELWVPEPEDFDEERSWPRPVGRNNELGLLKYRILIHLEIIEDFIVLEDPGVGPSSPGSGNSGVPDPGSFGGHEGYWTTRSVQWTAGVPDRRGPLAGGGNDHWQRGGGASAPSLMVGRSWQLPPVGSISRVADGRGPAVATGSSGVKDTSTALRPEVPNPALSRNRTGSSVVRTSADPNTGGRKMWIQKQVQADPDAVGRAGGTQSNAMCPTLDLLIADKVAFAPSGNPESGSVLKEGETDPKADTTLVIEHAVPREDALEDARGQVNTAVAEQSLVMAVPEKDQLAAGGGEIKSGEEEVSLQLHEQGATAEAVDVAQGCEVTMEVQAPTETHLQTPALDQHQAQNQENVAQLPKDGEQLPISEIGIEAQLLNMGAVTAKPMSTEEVHALGRMKEFCARILKALAPPLLREVESASTPRADVESFTPRRSVRFSTPAKAGPKPSKKASAAECALLKALGVTPGELEADESAVQEFRRFFNSPVREQHLNVLASIFGKTIPQRDELLRLGKGEAIATA